jgi:hypothetical protein
MFAAASFDNKSLPSGPTLAIIVLRKMSMDGTRPNSPDSEEIH